MTEVSKSSFEDIKAKTDSFRKYLKNLNIEIKPNAQIDIILNSISRVIELCHSEEIPNGEITELKDAAKGTCGTSYNPSVKHKAYVFNKLINSIR